MVAAKRDRSKEPDSSAIGPTIQSSLVERGGGSQGGGETNAIDLRGKRFVIIGLQGSGKTVLSQEIGQRHHSIVFDIHGEFPKTHFYRWVPKNKQYGEALEAEFTQACESFIFSNDYNFEMLIIDEANQYFPNGKPLPPAMARINDYNRHMKLAFGCITRRPTQLNTDLVELAHFLFIFSLHGKNTKRYLNDICEGLGDAAAQLKPHHFLLYEVATGQWQLCRPVELRKRSPGPATNDEPRNGDGLQP